MLCKFYMYFTKQIFSHLFALWLCWQVANKHWCSGPNCLLAKWWPSSSSSSSSVKWCYIVAASLLNNFYFMHEKIDRWRGSSSSIKQYCCGDAQSPRCTQLFLNRYRKTMSNSWWSLVDTSARKNLYASMAGRHLCAAPRHCIQPAVGRSSLHLTQNVSHQKRLWFSYARLKWLKIVGATTMMRTTNKTYILWAAICITRWANKR